MTDWPVSGPVTLRTNLGNHAISRPLRDGTIVSDLVTFDFCGPGIPNQGFKPMVRNGAFDAGELAIGTYLQALEFGKPLTMLPITVMARTQHNFLEYDASFSRLTPESVSGRRIGARIYAQTTAIWLRALLEEDYGVDLDGLKWLCTDEPHLAEYRDPDNVLRVDRPSSDLPAMLRGREVDVVIGNGKASEQAGIEPLIENPDDAAADWVERNGYLPINHVFVVDRNLADQRSDVIAEIQRMFEDARAMLPSPASGVDAFPLGYEALEPALAAFIEHAVRQKIVTRSFSVSELYTETTRRRHR